MRVDPARPWKVYGKLNGWGRRGRQPGGHKAFPIGLTLSTLDKTATSTMYYHRHRTLGRAMRSVRSVELADELRGLGMGSSAGTSLKSGSSTSTSERGEWRPDMRAG